MVLGSLFLWGCGGSPLESPSGPKPDESPDTVEQARTELEQAEQELEQAMAQGEPQTVAGEPPSHKEGTRAPQQYRHRADPCDIACRALASMRRAAGRLCALTHEEDHRCRSAQQRLADADRRVARACPACDRGQ